VTSNLKLFKESVLPFQVFVNYDINFFSFVYTGDVSASKKFPGDGKKATVIPELCRPTGECHPLTVVLDLPRPAPADVLELHVSAVYGPASQNCSAL